MIKILKVDEIRKLKKEICKFKHDIKNLNARLKDKIQDLEDLEGERK